ncbi:MAG: hypothetical protein ACP5OG_04000 [Candidatus Nanoarchaeia archaeon]
MNILNYFGVQFKEGIDPKSQSSIISNYVSYHNYLAKQLESYCQVIIPNYDTSQKAEGHVWQGDKFTETVKKIPCSLIRGPTIDFLPLNNCNECDFHCNQRSNSRANYRFIKMVSMRGLLDETYEQLEANSNYTNLDSVLDFGEGLGSLHKDVKIFRGRVAN